MLGSYTLAKSIDSSSTDNLGATVANPFDLRQERGRSDWDRRHAAVVSWLWSPPVSFDSGVANRVLGGWTFTGIHTLQSGGPLTFIMGDDVALDGTFGDQFALLKSGVTRDTIKISHSDRNAMVNRFFNTDAFVPNEPGAERHLRKRWARADQWTRLQQHRLLDHQGLRFPGALQIAVPFRVLQRFQPGELHQCHDRRNFRRLRPNPRRCRRPGHSVCLEVPLVACFSTSGEPLARGSPMVGFRQESRNPHLRHDMTRFTFRCSDPISLPVSAAIAH